MNDPVSAPEEAEVSVSDLKVAYVAGYGRSGSTLLDIILHAHPCTVSVGALHNYPRVLAADGDCGCGEPMAACPFWRQIGVVGDETLLSTQLAVERRTRTVALRTGLLSSETRNNYRRDQGHLLQGVHRHTKASIVVDSSKSAGETLGRPWALANIVGADVRIIHLVRNPRDVLASVLNGSGGGDRIERRSPGLLVLRTAVQWSLVNLSCLMLYRGDKVLRLRYETLVGEPRQSLERIGELLELDLSNLANTIEAGEAFHPGHNLGGNRLKRSERIVVRSPLKQDPEIQRRLGSLFDVLTFPARLVLKGRLC